MRATNEGRISMSTIKSAWLAGVGAAALLTAAADAQVIASDSADDVAYAFGWAEFDNGGTGFSEWRFASESANADGFAGFFLAEEPNEGLSNVRSGDPGFAWAIFANGGTGLEQAAAYRGFNTPISSGGVDFAISYEHGFIADGGQVGFAIRTGNANDTAGDVGIGARMQFFFQGGSGNYTVVDGSGVLDTGVPFTLDGLDIRVSFTGPDTYELSVVRYGDEIGSTLAFTFPERSLAGAGSIDSVAIYSSDGASSEGLNNDAYFNNLLIEVPTTGNTCPADLAAPFGTLDFFDVLEYLSLFDQGCD